MKVFKLFIIIVFLFILFHFANYMYYRKLEECTIIYKVNPIENDNLKLVERKKTEYTKDLMKCYSYNLLKLELLNILSTCGNDSSINDCELLQTYATNEGIPYENTDTSLFVTNMILNIMSSRYTDIYDKCNYRTLVPYFINDIRGDGDDEFKITNSLTDVNLIIEYINNLKKIKGNTLEDIIHEAYKDKLSLLEKICGENSNDERCTIKDGDIEIDSIEQLRTYIIQNETNP